MKWWIIILHTINYLHEEYNIILTVGKIILLWQTLMYWQWRYKKIKNKVDEIKSKEQHKGMDKLGINQLSKNVWRVKMRNGPRQITVTERKLQEMLLVSVLPVERWDVRWRIAWTITKYQIKLSSHWIKKKIDLMLCIISMTYGQEKW